MINSWENYQTIFYFKDFADLFGIPFRVILSPKTLAEGCVELKYRDNRMEARKIKTDEIVKVLMEEIKDEYAKYNSV